MNKVHPIDEEYHFNGRAIISETDLSGIITYANRKFCEISGYNAEELVGKPHNIIRHPDMPSAAFAQMWKTVKEGSTWRGMVKNLRKDGLYYWVETEIAPILNEEGVKVGYIAARKATSRENIQEAEVLYAKMREQER